MNPYLVSFLDAVRFALGTWRRRGIVTGLSVAAYVLMITSSFPLYSFQSLRYSIFSIGRVVAALTWNFHASYGAVGLGLLALYAVLSGIALYNVAVLVRMHGFKQLVNAGSITPAFLVGGCASCGAGLLGLLGFAGALAGLPFQGTELRVFGLLLLVYFLSSTGDPRTCRI